MHNLQTHLATVVAYTGASCRQSLPSLSSSSLPCSSAKLCKRAELASRVACDPLNATRKPRRSAARAPEKPARRSSKAPSSHQIRLKSHRGSFRQLQAPSRRVSRQCRVSGSLVHIDRRMTSACLCFDRSHYDSLLISGSSAVHTQRPWRDAPASV